MLEFWLMDITSGDTLVLTGELGKAACYGFASMFDQLICMKVRWL